MASPVPEGADSRGSILLAERTSDSDETVRRGKIGAGNAFVAGKGKARMGGPVSESACWVTPAPSPEASQPPVHLRNNLLADGSKEGASAGAFYRRRAPKPQ